MFGRGVIEEPSVPTDRTRKRRRGKYDEVSRLFAAEMQQIGYASEQIENGKHLWNDFVHKRHPRVAKPGVYAATVEYTIARMDFLADVTQVDVARRYGVSVSSVTRVHNELMRQLEIELFDERYSTMDSPLMDLLAEVTPLSELDEAAQLGLWAPPLMLDARTVEKVCALPPSGETWSGCRESLRAYQVHPVPFRPDVVLWVEETSEQVLAQRVLLPDDDDGALLETLLDAMFTPTEGAPRRPHVVRIDDQWLAGRLFEALTPLGIEVEVEATPVVEEILGLMEQSLLQDLPRHTFFEVDGITVDTLEQFFHSSARLLRAAPWAMARPNQAIAVDLSRWGFDRVCVSIVGAGQSDRGIVIFRSAEDFLAFEELSEIMPDAVVTPYSTMMEVLTLSFQQGNELDTNRRKEVLRHGWEVDDALSFPRLVHADADGIAIPLTTDTYKAACACGDGLAQFTSGHPELFTLENSKLTSEVVHLPGYPEEEPVLVTAPHPDLVEF